MSARALALTPAGWWLQHHLRVRRHDQRAASYAPTRASNWLSPPRRSRRGQCDGERITTQPHEREQGSHARFQCRSPAARRRSGRVRLRFPPPGPWPPTLARSALRAARVPAASFRSLARPARALRWDSIAAKAGLVFSRLAASSMALSHRAKIGLDGAPLALHSGLLDRQVGEGLRLDCELVDKAVALGLPSFVVRSAELGDRRRAQGDGPS